MPVVEVCKEPLCDQFAVYRGRCREHANQANKRNHPNKNLYRTSRWKTFRKTILHRDGWQCVYLEHGTTRCDQMAQQVDHIVPIEDGGDFWDPDNCQSLCLTHHGSKTMSEMRLRGNMLPPGYG